VVLGHPEPLVTELLGADRERRGMPEGFGGGSGGVDRSDIEDRERYVNHNIIPLVVELSRGGMVQTGLRPRWLAAEPPVKRANAVR
jgi:hypothetical protein